MNLTISEIEWECTQYGMPNLPNSIFDTTISFSYSFSTNSEEMIAKLKAKSLIIVTLNFKSTFIKIDKICHFLNDNNIDIIPSCNTHVSPSISTSELLPSV